MYIALAECQIPSNPGISIWRYIDFAKFVDMLERQQLHFARLDQLDDPFEGALSADAFQQLRDWNEQHPVPTANGRPYWENRTRAIHRSNRGNTYVNCWHMNEYESQAMWRLYSRDGIAIRSTFERLRSSFNDAPQYVHIGEVIYRDHRGCPRSEDLRNPFALVLRKRMSFEHERELRAIATSGFITAENDVLGIPIDVNLPTLIERVYVAPGRPTWFRELVACVMKRYELNVPLEASSLDERPNLV